MKFNELDVVIVLIDFPEYNVFKGQRGTVIDTYTNPSEVYEVEFYDADNQDATLVSILPEHLEKYKG